MKTEMPLVISLTYRFEAAPERVFDAFLNPEIAREFLFTKPTTKIVRVKIDPRVGGNYSFVDRRDGQEIEFCGRYLEIERPRRLVFSLNVAKFKLFDDRVIIEILSSESGCELTLTHQLCGELAEFKPRIELGWKVIFELLGELLSELKVS